MTSEEIDNIYKTIILDCKKLVNTVYSFAAFENTDISKISSSQRTLFADKYRALVKGIKVNATKLYEASTKD